MRLSRRKFLAVLGASAVCRELRAQTSRAGAWQAAAKYSAERRGVSLVIMEAGRVLFEDYPGAGGVAKGWELASGTKSFTGIMAAAAQADGLLDIDAPCAVLLPEWRDDPMRSGITVRHLLTLTSGLDEAGAVARPPPYLGAIEARAVASPGARFAYGPTPFQAFGEVLRRALANADEPADPIDWLQQRVFDRLGIRPTEWNRGRDGNPYLPQGAHFSAREWALFGQWVLDGAHGVDRGVYAALFESTSANPGYGLSWWLLRPGLIGPSPRAGVDAESIGTAALDEDAVMAAGAGDQRLYLLRKRGLVVARQANRIVLGMSRRARKWSDAEFLQLLLA